MEQGSRAGGAVSLDLVEQICSKLCHDLAGPVGAIRNGLELMVEGGGGDQALDLIGHSADQAAQRLRLFRLAYGRATRDGLRSFTDLREAAQDWLAGGRVTLRWLPGQPDDSLAARPGLGRLLLNLVVLGTEIIPQGGIIAVSGVGSVDAGVVAITVTGRGMRWSVEIAAALAGRLSDDEVGSRTIHATLSARFATHYGLSLIWEAPDAETRTLRLAW